MDSGFRLSPSKHARLIIHQSHCERLLSANWFDDRPGRHKSNDKVDHVRPRQFPPPSTTAASVVTGPRGGPRRSMSKEELFGRSTLGLVHSACAFTPIRQTVGPPAPLMPTCQSLRRRRPTSRPRNLLRVRSLHACAKAPSRWHCRCNRVPPVG